jgi:hypothetical protein
MKNTFAKTTLTATTLALALIASFAGATAAHAEQPYDYACTLKGEANDNFNKHIRLEISPDNKFLTFYGNGGENCNGNFDANYRQMPGNDPVKYSRYWTDCEREDGFIQMLLSEEVLARKPEGTTKMRIRGAFFQERLYDCKKI